MVVEQEMSLRCNMCEETISLSSVAQHVAGRNHAVKKRVAEFMEMNSQIKQKPQQSQEDTSVVDAWIKDLYNYDFLSSGRT